METTTKENREVVVSSKDGLYKYVSDRKVERKAGTENYRNCPITPKIMQWAQEKFGKDLQNGKQVVFKLLQEAGYTGTIEDLSRDAPEAVADKSPAGNMGKLVEAYRATIAKYLVEKKQPEAQVIGMLKEKLIEKYPTVVEQNQMLQAIIPKKFEAYKFEETFSNDLF